MNRKPVLYLEIVTLIMSIVVLWLLLRERQEEKLRQREILTIKGTGDVYLANGAERERMRKHPDFRPPWGDGR